MAALDLSIAQALLTVDARGVRIVGQSEGFDALEAERIAVLFGPRPENVACPVAHFACPFGLKLVSVVRVEDRPDGALGFHFLVLGRQLYGHLGDPFAIADRMPANWGASGELPTLAWPPEQLPSRSVQRIQDLLRGCDGESEEMALLLGSTQVLLDGGRVIVKRSSPAEQLLRKLWQLLPDRSRAELWPASFAFAADLGFDAVAMPALPSHPGNVDLTEEALKGYPAGSYEQSLQAAVEAGDQRSLDHLFARRTGGDTIRLGLGIIGGALLLAALFKFVLP